MERTRRGPRLSLRARSSIAVGTTALVLAVVLGTIAYFGVRSSLIDERQASVQRQADLRARSLRTDLRSESADPTDALDRLGVGTQTDAVLVVGDETFSTTAGLDESALPTELVEAVGEDQRAGQQRAEVGGTVGVVTGVPIAEVDGAYFEITSLESVRDGLSGVQTPLVWATVAATVAGALIGALISGAVLRPVETTSRLARRIADGDVDARLDVGDDPALVPLADSFNQMVDELQARIVREVGFASNVSHELRGPLMALDGAMQRVERRRSELSPETAAAVDALEEEVRGFNRLVLDLLEISRFDARTAELVTREVDLVGLTEAVVAEVDPDLPVEAPGGSVPAVVDPRRVQQVLVNLIDNAERYAGGAVLVVVAARGDRVQISVEDQGPGVAPDEREAIFERFQRGAVGTARGPASGSGLGLALVAYHVQLHGGTVTVHDRAGGGARFVVDLPAAPP